MTKLFFDMCSGHIQSRISHLCGKLTVFARYISKYLHISTSTLHMAAKLGRVVNYHEVPLPIVFNHMVL